MPRTDDQIGANPPETGKRARRSADLSRRLLDAAVAEFSENGFEAGKVSEIARRSGLSTGAIYSRWRNKREYFLGAVRHAASQRLSSDGETQSQLGRIAAALSADQLRSDDDTGALFLEACIIARRDATMRASIAESFDVEAEALSNLVTEGKAAGIFDESLSTGLVVLCCQALSIGMQLTLSMSDDLITGEDADQWDVLIGRLVNSWAPPATARQCAN